jgi:hypothetical protein
MTHEISGRVRLSRVHDIYIPHTGQSLVFDGEPSGRHDTISLIEAKPDRGNALAAVSLEVDGVNFPHTDSADTHVGV